MRSSLEFDWNNHTFGENVWANPSGDSAGSVWKVSAFLVLTEKRSSCRHDTYLSWLQRAVFLSITIDNFLHFVCLHDDESAHILNRNIKFRVQAGNEAMPQNSYSWISEERCANIIALARSLRVSAFRERCCRLH